MRPRLPHQLPAVQFAADRDCVGFYLDKRLGKCACFIEWAVTRPGASHWLVVAPYSACGGWVDEIEADGYSAVWLLGTQAERAAQLLASQSKPLPLFVVTNPQGLFVPAGRRSRCEPCRGMGYVFVYDHEGHCNRRMRCRACQAKGYLTAKSPSPTEIALMTYDGICWDESIQIANPKSQTNRIAHRCFGSADHRTILSGEYAPEGPHQIYEQMRWLCGGRWMGRANFWNWRNDNFINLGYTWHPKPGKWSEIKSEVAKDCYILSRADAGHVQTTTQERRYCELPRPIRKAYDLAEEEFAVGATETKHSIVVFNWLAQIAGGYPKNFPHLHSPHKYELLLEVLAEYPKEPVVVLFRFNTALYAVADLMKREHEVVTGKTKPHDRAERVRSFQKMAGRTVMLMQAKCAKYGMDLSVASVIVWFDLPDSYDDISQANDRIVHPNKHGPLMYVYLLARNTTDEDRYLASRDKKVTSRFFMTRVLENMDKRRAA